MSTCQDTINDKKKKPPTWCNTLKANYCATAQNTAKICHANGYAPGTPVPEEVNDESCWCCCSCFAYYTQIAVSQAANKTFSYKMIQDIALNEMKKFTVDYPSSAYINEGKEILVGTNQYPNKNDQMKHDLELFPFVKIKSRKTLITPIIEKRLAQNSEQERLTAEI